MRKTLLMAALAAMAAAPPALAQSEGMPIPPDQGGMARPESTTPPSTGSMPAGTQPGAPGGMSQPRHHYHKRGTGGTETGGPAMLAPRLPAPHVGTHATPEEYLRAAQSALARHHTGEAQQALEMAETRLLSRSTPVDAARQPDQDQAVQQVGQARQALGQGDLKSARAAIESALNTLAGPGASPGTGGPGAADPDHGAGDTGMSGGRT
ncbi:MAG TPA: hypothetical protein VMI52_01300 [Acetobacteraceae bacterium]|nr:hypothetical protein [Acetobacteraceae bacterium]